MKKFYIFLSLLISSCKPCPVCECKCDTSVCPTTKPTTTIEKWELLIPEANIISNADDFQLIIKSDGVFQLGGLAHKNDSKIITDLLKEEIVNSTIIYPNNQGEATIKIINSKFDSSLLRIDFKLISGSLFYDLIDSKLIILVMTGV